MTVGWEGVIDGYNLILEVETYYSKSQRASPYNQSQYDHAHGMLRVIPAMRANPLLENYEPVPYTSHEVLRFLGSNAEINVWCNISDQTYSVRLIRDGKTDCEISVDIENVVETILQYIDQMRT
jgi:hypothetical protein